MGLSPALTGTKLELFFDRLLFKLNYSVMLVNSHLVCQPPLGFLSLLYLFESPYLDHKARPHLETSGEKRGRPRSSWRRNLEVDMRRYVGRTATTGPGP